MKKTLHFKTNTLLKNLVGKDLINDDTIAIVELVKNSYDANSEQVVVQFTNFKGNQGDKKSTGNSQIIISDKGIGMDITDIEDKWLNIAYSEKKLLEQEEGKYLAGNKGIGRFSCDRLGENLNLLTRKKDQEIIHLFISWPDFEIEGQKDLTIQEINLVVETIDEDDAAKSAGLSQFPSQGTVLVISSLRSLWDKDKLLGLKTSLEKFLNPNQLFQRNKFRIYLSVPDYEDDEKKKDYPNKISVEIQNQIFEKLKFNTTFIDSNISKENKTITTTLYHEGDKVFELIEKNDAFVLLPGTHVVIYYLNPYKKAYFNRQTGVRSVDFGSIFLFLNGFRIAPYGDRGDDWLGLDVRKTQGTTRYLSSRDIVGRIEISGTEQQFMPISSREGLKNTPEFIQLREKYFLNVLRRLEKFVVDGLDWDSVPEEVRKELNKEDGYDWKSTSEQYSESWDKKQQRITLSIMKLIGASPKNIDRFWFDPGLIDGVYETRQEEIKNLIAEIEKIEPEKVDSNLKKNLSRFKKLIEEKEQEALAAKTEAADLRVEVAQKDAIIIEQEEKIEVLEGTTEVYRSQTLFLQQVVSLDVDQLTLYHHDIKLQAHIIDNHLGGLLKEVQKLPNNRKMLNQVEAASLASKRISAIAQYATKANFRVGAKKQPTDVPAYIEQYVLRVAKAFNSLDINIDIQNSLNELFEINISQIELSILLDNIISNSIKASAKTLFIGINKIAENTLRVSFIDDGNGFDKKLPNIEAIFEPGITTTLGGSGLGLYHVKNIVQNMDGRIEALPGEPKGMEIRVEISR